MLKQLYTGRIDEAYFTLLYALTCNRKRLTYDEIWDKVFECQPEIQPAYVMTDFEQASIAALKEKFPNSIQRCCAFHLGKSIFKHIVEAGLKTVYSEDPNFAWHMKFLYALAFVPIDKVAEAFDLITALPFFEYDENKAYSVEINSVVDYFETTYIGRTTGTQGARRKPLFPVELWNVHDLTLKGNGANSCFDFALIFCLSKIINTKITNNSGVPRTNNRVEGWHNAIHGAIGCDHPSLSRFIEFMKAEQGRTEFQLNQTMAAMATEKPKKKYRDYDARLKKVVEAFANEEDGDLMKFIQKVSHNLNYNN